MTDIFLYKGDNVEVLKSDVDIKPNIIYMDPPYNTWNSTLTYKDKQDSDSWADKFRELVTLINDRAMDDAVFFVSINDEELANVIIVLREVLGKKSIISISPRRTHSGHKTSSTISNQHDYIVMAKKGNVKFNGVEINTDSYKHEDEYLSKRGKYQLRRIDYKEFKWSESLDFEYEIDGKKYYPGGVTKKEWESRRENHSEKDWAWIWSKAKIDFGLKNGYVVEKNGKLFKKTYTKSEIKKLGPSEYKVNNLVRTKKVDSLHFTNKDYALKTTKTHPERLFDYPKSDELISSLIKLPDFEKRFVLDPFGGTGTTAVMSYENNVDEVHIIQLDEKTKENSLAYKEGYNSIYKLTKDNIGQRINDKKKVKEVKWQN